MSSAKGSRGMGGPCDDIRVIDLSSGPAGGIATMMLADYGADVIKVERPGGDPLRRLTASPVWLRGKRSITLDLAEGAARERLRELAAGADVVVASFRPGRAEALGADYATLSEGNSGLVYCSVTGFGPRGPYAGYPGYEGVVAAKSGRMQHFGGVPRREGPAFAAVQTGTHAAAQSALTGILGALLVRDQSGRGQLIETSLLQGLMGYDMNSLVRTQLERSFPAHMEGNQLGAYGAAPPIYYQPVMAKDGQWIQPANLVDHLFHAFIATIGLEDIYLEERFHGAPRRLAEADREELRERMLRRVLERDGAEWMELFRNAQNVAAEPFGNTLSALSNADLVANAEVVEVEHPRLGPVRQLGLVANLTQTPGTVGPPAAEPGAQTDEVLAEPQRAAWTPPNGAGATPAHPLEGVTVLEFATVIAAPYGAALLADLGARVIKVEPIGGEPFRGNTPGLPGHVGVAKTTAGKEGLCLELKSEEGQAIVARLIERADVLIHNYRPGVPERLGIGYELASALNPGIVHVSVNGYGPQGPSASRPSAHPVPGAVVGGALQQAGSGMPPAHYEDIDELREAARWLFRSNEANPDPNTSMVVASSALLGLYARRRTSRGQQIFVSMLGANTYANADAFVDYEGASPRQPLDAELHGPGPLYRLYEAREGWVFLAVTSDEEWARLCGVLGGSPATDPRFASAEAREANADALAGVLAACFAGRDADDWERTLIAVDVGCVRADRCGPGEFFLDDPHMHENGFTATADHAVWGEHQRWGPMVTFTETPGRYGPGVLAGQHTDAILDELGYDAEAIARLREDGVAWSAEVPPIEAMLPD